MLHKVSHPVWGMSYSHYRKSFTHGRVFAIKAFAGPSKPWKIIKCVNINIAAYHINTRRIIVITVFKEMTTYRRKSFCMIIHVLMSYRQDSSFMAVLLYLTIEVFCYQIGPYVKVIKYQVFNNQICLMVTGMIEISSICHKNRKIVP